MNSGSVGQIRVRAPAKINLTLRVLGGRPDGYHELRTTFQSLALHDTLTFVRTRERFAIECDDPRCPADRTNLVWKAAEALWRAHGRPGSVAGVHIRIRKRIPMQAGLGGGSSDAAATLQALAALWGIRLARDRTHAIARALGADVPFFLEGGTVLGLERGDELFPLLDGPPHWVVLVLPDFGVSTVDAYRWWDERRKRKRSATGHLQGVRNDLQTAVAAHHPRITRAVNRLRRLGAREAGMSGSGSAVFGLFEREVAAQQAAATIDASSCVTLVTRTTTRRQHHTLTRVQLMSR